MQKSLFDMFGGGKKAETKPKTAAPKTTPKPESNKVKPPAEEILPINTSTKAKSLKIPDEIKNLITWKDGSPVPYSFLVSMSSLLENEPKRNAKIEIATKHFLAVACSTPEDLIPLIFIVTGELRPAHEGVKLDLGENIIKKGIAQATGRTEDDIKREFDIVGDLALLAMKSKKKQNSLDAMMGKKVEPLTIRGVYSKLLDIAKMEGNNVVRHKTGSIAKLLSQTENQEAKFIIRSLETKLTVGCAQSTVLVSLGRCFRWRETYLGLKPEPSEETLTNIGKEFKAIFHRYPLMDKLITKMLEGGFDLVEKQCNLVVGVPVVPMLAKPAKSTNEVKARLGDGKITCEYKYDGERAQIHKCKNGTMQIFSRSAKDSTKQFEDIKPLILSQIEGEEFIIDSEIVAYDIEKGYILPFQTLMHRSRKGSDEPSPIQVCVFAFDILYLNGESLIDKPLKERREILHKIIKPVEHRLQTATYMDTGLDNIKDFFNEAVSHRTEGLMIKGIDSCYEPGRRSPSWAKLKKDYVKGLGTESESSLSDTVDVVVVGATHGKKKRSGHYGCYLVAVWNEEVGKFQTICEVGTGFSDQNFIDFHEMMEDHLVSKPPNEVQYGKNKPDVYIKPFLVWEIAVADITISPTQMACFGDVEDDAGISLRFGRFMRIREDKEPMQCTNTHQILEMYYAQPNIADGKP
ncbi:DNA ligase 1 [Tritrichomonas foetus]|uniref:DNA ligase n=1 Tax=Tritrichomonas foetus TaxID=1144522 RepID=A0A1J4KHD9_9EUKA|nr:DNA ligase 1 [Tritrichomonas foetus]|eukprot:OHT10360.1 DNA ligase 1 [Tritrichomonas foetus]